MTAVVVPVRVAFVVHDFLLHLSRFSGGPALIGGGGKARPCLPLSLSPLFHQTSLQPTTTTTTQRPSLLDFVLRNHFTTAVSTPADSPDTVTALATTTACTPATRGTCLEPRSLAGHPSPNPATPTHRSKQTLRARNARLEESKTSRQATNDERRATSDERRRYQEAHIHTLATRPSNRQRSSAKTVGDRPQWMSTAIGCSSTQTHPQSLLCRQ